jgi:hypothetical protein
LKDFNLACGQTGAKLSATRTSFQGETVTGGINRRFFTGGAAKGIPRQEGINLRFFTGEQQRGYLDREA